MPAPLTHSVGDLVSGWRIIEPLGRGAHGTVYRVVGGAGEARLLKEMHHYQPADLAAESLNRFIAECRLVGSLDADFLPRGRGLTVPGPFHIDPRTGSAGEAAADTVTIDARHYLLLDVPAGETLEELARTVPPDNPLRAPSTVVVWLTQIASALDRLHDMGLVHRDVKPENIIISDNGAHATLIDLGLAAPYTEASGYGTQPVPPASGAGAPPYAPPDPYEQDEPTPRSDVYALGLTARRYFSGIAPTSPAAIERLRRVNLQEVAPELRPHQALLLDRAIEADPSQRPATMLAFADGLRRPQATRSAPSWVSHLEVSPPAIHAGTFRPGQMRDLSVLLHDKRPGRQPEGEAISEDPNLRILPPALRGHDVLLQMVLRVPANQAAGSYTTTLTIRTSHEEHEVPVTFEVSERERGARSGCIGAVLPWLGV